MRSVPRARACRFSSVTSGARPAKSGGQGLLEPVDHAADLDHLEPDAQRLGQGLRSSEAIGLEWTEGIATPVTRSGPSASAATAAVSAESMPPDRPITTPGKPFLST